MQLRPEQLRAIDDGQVVSLTVDERECVLLAAKTFDRIRALVEDWNPATMQRHLTQMMADDWNDPAMSVYDE